MPQRRDEERLIDIVHRADLVARIVEETSFEAWSEDEIAVGSLLYPLAVIGEASSGVSAGLRQRHPEVPWRVLVDFRNVVVHAYADLRHDIVWRTATHDVPACVTASQASCGMSSLSQPRLSTRTARGHDRRRIVSPAHALPGNRTASVVATAVASVLPCPSASPT